MEPADSLADLRVRIPSHPLASEHRPLFRRQRMMRNFLLTPRPTLPSPLRGTARSRYLPRFSLRPPTRPLKWKPFAPATSTWVKVPTLTMRVQALLLAVLPPRLDALALDLAPGRKSEHREGSGSRLGVRVADLGARL